MLRLPPSCGTVLTCAAHRLEAVLLLMKCHLEYSILKGYFAYYIAPPSTHLLVVNYAYDSERCKSSTALHNLQYDHDHLIFSLSLHMDRCTALSRFPARAMTPSHPYAVTHATPVTHAHRCCWLQGAVMETYESWVSLKGHFRSR